MAVQNEREILLRLSEMASFAEYLPLEIITQRNAEPEYPVTVGELLASYILNTILRHEWESTEHEYMVEPFANALNQLDMGVDRPEVWKDLFLANSKLREYLEG